MLSFDVCVFYVLSSPIFTLTGWAMFFLGLKWQCFFFKWPYSQTTKLRFSMKRYPPQDIQIRHYHPCMVHFTNMLVDFHDTYMHIYHTWMLCCYGVVSLVMYFSAFVHPGCLVSCIIYRPVVFTLLETHISPLEIHGWKMKAVLLGPFADFQGLWLLVFGKVMRLFLICLRIQVCPKGLLGSIPIGWDWNPDPILFDWEGLGFSGMAWFFYQTFQVPKMEESSPI